MSENQCLILDDPHEGNERMEKSECIWKCPSCLTIFEKREDIIHLIGKLEDFLEKRVATLMSDHCDEIVDKTIFNLRMLRLVLKEMSKENVLKNSKKMLEAQNICAKSQGSDSDENNNRS